MATWLEALWEAAGQLVPKGYGLAAIHAIEHAPLWDYWASGYSPSDAAVDILSGLDSSRTEVQLITEERTV